MYLISRASAIFWFPMHIMFMRPKPWFSGGQWHWYRDERHGILGGTLFIYEFTERQDLELILCSQLRTGPSSYWIGIPQLESRIERNIFCMQIARRDWSHFVLDAQTQCDRSSASSFQTFGRSYAWKWRYLSCTLSFFMNCRSVSQNHSLSKLRAVNPFLPDQQVVCALSFQTGTLRIWSLSNKSWQGSYWRYYSRWSALKETKVPRILILLKDKYPDFRNSIVSRGTKVHRTQKFYCALEFVFG